MTIPSEFNIFAAVFKQNDGDGERVEYFNQRDLQDAGIHHSGAEQYATDCLMEEGEYLDDVIEEEHDVDLQTIADVCGETLDQLRVSGCFEASDNDGVQPEFMLKLERLVVSLHAIGYDWAG